MLLINVYHNVFTFSIILQYNNTALYYTIVLHISNNFIVKTVIEFTDKPNTDLRQ